MKVLKTTNAFVNTRKLIWLFYYQMKMKTASALGDLYETGQGNSRPEIAHKVTL